MFPTDNTFETKVTLESSANIVVDESFRILLLGNWSGRSSNRNLDSVQTLPIEIDRDNFEEILKKFAIQLKLELQGGGDHLVSVSFDEFDDFHPDNIFRQLPCFSHLRSLRRDLLNADTFNAAASEVRSWFKSTDSNPVIHSFDSPDNPDKNTKSVDLLDQILNQTSEKDPVSQSENIQNSDLRNFVGQLVKPFIIKTDEVEQNDLLSVVDETTSKLMREIIHHPLFKELESLWRGLKFLVKRIETDTDLKIFIYDVTKEEILENLKSTPDLIQTSVYKLFNFDDYQKSTGFWSVVGGFYDFKLDVADTALLIRIAQISDIADTPFISSFEPKIFIKNSHDNSSDKFFDKNLTPDQAKLLETIQTLPEASRLGFVFPRFLARLPYGEKTEPLNSFSFEEFDDLIGDNSFLWLNSVSAGILLLAQSFQLHGWQMGDAFQRQIDDVPLYFYQSGNESYRSILQIELNESSCLDLLEMGIMPLISFQSSDSIRLVRFQSVKTPFSPLKGKWSRF